MLRYTARNGTTFHFSPDARGCVQVTGQPDDQPFELDLDDLREFVQHLDDLGPETADEPTDADITAVGPD